MHTRFDARLAICALAASIAFPNALGMERPNVLAQGASTAADAGFDATVLAGLRWRSIGPARGGRSQTVAGSRSRPLEYYFGATGGGLSKTTDGGTTWRPVSDRFFCRRDRDRRIGP